jgi:hypothetical protein
MIFGILLRILRDSVFATGIFLFAKFVEII